ncbi:MAG: FKBP-type peptidyl-prolyl cis-trans isomerase [Rhodoglobus sp.]
MRAAASLIVAVGLVASLAACSTPTTTNADCTPTASGSASEGVKVSGAFDTKPKVDLKSPITVDATQRTVVIAGDGATAVDGDNVSVEITLYNGETGKELTGTGYTEGSATSFAVDPTKVLPGLVKTLECTNVGSRVVSVIPPADGFGEAGNSQIGLTADQSLVVVVDVLAIADAPLPKADGKDQPATAGFPTVVLDDTGRPTITIPDTAPPTDLQIALLKKGDGAEVTAGANVVVHYVGMNWNTKTVFDESWARGTPATFNTSQVIAGFTKALVGQKVGSQVEVIIPPADGYGDAGNPPSIGGTDTIVFVIDILGIG